MLRLSAFNSFFVLAENLYPACRRPHRGPKYEDEEETATSALKPGKLTTSLDKSVTGRNGSTFPGAEHSVDCVSTYCWYQMAQFVSVNDSKSD